jgi:hypothetical protein
MAEASSTTTTSDGPGEEAVLDRMLTRLALTQDTQLEKVLSKLLPLAISRLGSSHHPTRLKVKQTSYLLECNFVVLHLQYPESSNRPLTLTVYFCLG